MEENVYFYPQLIFLFTNAQNHIFTYKNIANCQNGCYIIPINSVYQYINIKSIDLVEKEGHPI